jgi:hypothetical protein
MRVLLFPQRPACRRCTSTERTCGGYEISLALLEGNSSKTRNVLPKQESSPVDKAMVLSQIPPLTLPASQAESHAFDFFRLKTAVGLPGSSWAMSWQNLVLQASLHEPAIWHGILAVGSL